MPSNKLIKLACAFELSVIKPTVEYTETLIKAKAHSS